MRESLYLRLQSTNPEALTAFCVAGGNVLHSWPVQEAPLREVLARAANKRLVVLVPAAEVHLTEVTVAARSAARILQAAPFALEDQLADDVEDLHFALGGKLPGGGHAIAAVARARMDEWLAPLREAQLRPELLIPETLCLPLNPTGWTGLAEAGQITVRTGVSGGFVCAEDDLLAMLELADPEHKTPLRMIVPRSYDGDFTRLEWPLELLPGNASAFEALLQHHDGVQGINLLQGDYSQSQGLRRAWQPWRAAAGLAAGLIVVSGLSHGVHAYSLGKELRYQNEQNEQRFRSLFPAETRIVDLQVQLDQQEQALKGGAQSGGFLKLTETLARALSANPGFTVQGMQFREGALYVNLTALDLQRPEQLQAWFAQNPEVSYERQSLDSNTEGVQLRIKLGGGA